jgi:hypothetical protein
MMTQMLLLFVVAVMVSAQNDSASLRGRRSANDAEPQGAPRQPILLLIKHLDVIELPPLRVFALKRCGHGLPVLRHLGMAG